MALRDHLESVERQTGRRDPLLDEAVLPPGTDYLWSAFIMLRRGGAVSLSGISAYQDLMGVRLSPGEIDLIFALDEGAREATK